MEEASSPILAVSGPVPPEAEGRSADSNYRGGDRRGARQAGSRGDRRGPRREDRPARNPEEKELIEKVVFINRCAKVVKGGRRFSFSALIVVGDGAGKVGVGFGKANEVSEAIRKGNEDARGNLLEVALERSTIPHEVVGEFGGSRVLLKPASEGTGLIAGGGARAVVEAAGIKDVLSKSLGSSNPANVVKATLDALLQLRKREEIFKARGRSLKPAASRE
ncbi:MAG: 30S ribosomal protein S5 [Verrucomicrobiia bacterium]